MAYTFKSNLRRAAVCTGGTGCMRKSTWWQTAAAVYLLLCYCAAALGVTRKECKLRTTAAYDRELLKKKNVFHFLLVGKKLGFDSLAEHARREQSGTSKGRGGVFNPAFDAASVEHTLVHPKES